MKKNITKDPIYKKYILENKIEDFELKKELESNCEIRQTKRHLVRKMNTKSTYFYEKD